MENEIMFRRQCDFLTRIPSSDVSPTLLFLLGVAHARTSIDIQTLFPFLQDADLSFRSNLITPAAKFQIDLQVYQGFLGKARDLLTENKLLVSSSVFIREEPPPSLCSICRLAITSEPGFTPSDRCGHEFHLKCAQSSVRRIMMEGGFSALACPGANCPTQLSETDLGALFSPDDYQILIQFWAKSPSDGPFIPVICPTFTCKASTMWKKSQFYECRECKVRYCLRCLRTVKGGHECGDVCEEQVVVGEEFAKGSRYKACLECGYWCDLTGKKTITCRCGRNICTKCVLYLDQCECNATFIDKLISLPEKLFKNL